MAAANRVVTAVTEAVAPVAEDLGYRLWDVEYGKEGARRVLRVTIDKDGGVTIDDCERMHRAIDPVLDAIDPIEDSYDLEVSSPGIERDLRTDAHIDASVGERVELRFFAPVEGRKTLSGVLLGRNETGAVLVEVDGAPRAIPRESIAKIRTVFDF